MLFHSLEFLLFFAVVYSLYLIIPHRWQNRMLIAASCFFYSAWNWKFLPVMFVSITTDFYCARYLAQSSDPKTRRLLLIISITVNLAILGFFKYCNFFASSLQALLNPILPLGVPQFITQIVLPVGVSFYTFEAISYTVDVYRGTMKPTQRYWDYVLFVIYFPHLVAGPIMRAKDFIPQITSPRVVKWSLVSEGAYLVFWGLFEKIFIASNLAKIVDPIFDRPAPYHGPEVLIGLYAFAFQIFCDFDAYSNIARGLGKCMGFDIMINFNLPYFAKNPREFWQRWHISLSTWLRDYLYIPLGGNQRGSWLTLRNLGVTMLLGGLWHGASWTFVLWGVYHGLLLILYRLKSDIKSTGKDSAFIHFGKMVLMFHLVTLGWLFFRAQSLPQIVAMLQALFTDWTWEASLQSQALALLGFLTPLWLIQLGQWSRHDLMFFYKQHWLVKTSAYAVMVYLILGWGVMTAEEFIYFQF